MIDKIRSLFRKPKPLTPLLAKIIDKSPHLKWMERGTIFITLHGSRAFNTHIETSDYDYKGVAIPPKQYFLGLQHRFEQAELKDPDTVIYEIRKFFSLASACNPSVIETLYTDPADHLLVSPLACRYPPKMAAYSAKGPSYPQGIRTARTHTDPARSVACRVCRSPKGVGSVSFRLHGRTDRADENLHPQYHSRDVGRVENHC
jgi:hypothetical protein